MIHSTAPIFTSVGGGSVQGVSLGSAHVCQGACVMGALGLRRTSGLPGRLVQDRFHLVDLLSPKVDHCEVNFPILTDAHLPGRGRGGEEEEEEERRGGSEEGD